MSGKIPSPCNYQGCRNTTTSRFCAAHADQAHARAKEYDRERAGGLVRKLYFSKTWEHVRGNVLARDGQVCTACHATGASEVDHVIPAEQWVASHGGELRSFFDEDNLTSLCKPCHSKKTARERNSRAEVSA